MYLYSNILGVFVFNQNLQIREKVLFSEQESREYLKILEKGEIPSQEKIFLEKFKSIKNLRLEPDDSVLSVINTLLMDFKDMFYERNLYLTKTQIRESVTDDLLIIQVSSSIMELGKSINLLTKRLREWYGYVLPEVEDKLQDNSAFSERVIEGYDRLRADFAVINGMGKKLSAEDMAEIKDFADSINLLQRQKESKELFLEKIMRKTCPNLTEVAGHLTGAKLLAIAGSLRNMVMMPASTIQLLGAEKALFRHMVTKSKSPKHGVIVEHPLLQRVSRQDKGKAARSLADKISLAVKVDYFKGNFIGDKLKAELEAKFR
ncbi:MAG: NOP58 family protein [Candidatus Woesearchaeota archaeon]|nr:NOP58 family protein [Candidatus Woesearchaeota archaeon]